ncbi:MAG: aminoacetone oxidase family FAD-binding enzyme [Lachnospiraceae bacterium]|nr:aminoacetone oxidase family FAD-binding enzyme [Lachnospiraceae bacterium]
MAEEKKNIIAVIGGGAGGMTAAIFASLDGHSRVVIFEAKDAPGKKIKGTGNGKCNFTNDNMDLKFYRGEDPKFAADALKRFDNEAAKLFFKKMGIRPKEKNGGYIYPNSEEASSVSAALRLTAEERDVKFIFEKVREVKKAGNGFVVNDRRFDKVILACGSFANMKDRNEFNGYVLAKGLGHRITPLYPALCQIRCAEKFFKTINGVRTEASLKVLEDDQEMAFEKGELLFTDYGVSGIPAFQLSRFCAEAKAKGKKVTLKINFLPDTDISEVKREVDTRLTERAGKGRNIEESMYGLLNHKLNFVLLNLSGMDPTGKISGIDEKKKEKLIKNLTDLTLEVTGTNDFSFAQVVAGGVDTREIDEETMGSLKCPGLYFAGEIMDIDGTCGGYNLQWAWSSGAIAGLAASGNDVPEDFITFINGRFE